MVIRVQIVNQLQLHGIKSRPQITKHKNTLIYAGAEPTKEKHSAGHPISEKERAESAVQNSRT